MKKKEIHTFLSGQLYFSKTSSYILVAPSVTSIMAWLHTLPRPVRLNCIKTENTCRHTIETKSDLGYYSNIKQSPQCQFPLYVMMISTMPSVQRSVNKEQIMSS